MFETEEKETNWKRPLDPTFYYKTRRYKLCVDGPQDQLVELGRRWRKRAKALTQDPCANNRTEAICRGAKAVQHRVEGFDRPWLACCA